MEIVNISEEELKKDAAFQRMGPVDALELLNQLIRECVEKAKKEQELLCELDEKNHQKKWISLFGNPPVETALKAFFANPQEGLVLKASKLITSTKLKELFAQTPNKGMKIRFLSLPGSPSLTDKEVRILATECPNLEYLNLDGCEKLKQIFTAEKELPLLARLEAKDCVNLEKFVSYSPIRVLRIGSERISEIFVEKSSLDIFGVTSRGSKFDFSVRTGRDFQMKSLSQTISKDNFIQKALFEEEEMAKYFKNLKITIGTYSISSGKDLAIFITVIDISSSQIKTKDLQKLIKLKLINLNHLNLCDNEIRDKGLEILARGNWPFLETLKLNNTEITITGVETMRASSKWSQLKQLHLAKNLMNNQVLKTLSQGDWPLLETIDLSFTKVTKVGVLYLIINSELPNLQEFKFARGAGFVETLRKNWSLVETFDMSNGEITQKEVSLLVGRLKFPQLKYLSLSYNQKINDEAMEILVQGDWLFLEILDLNETKVTAIGVEEIATRSKWPRLKHLFLHQNELNGKWLETLSRGNWPLLETIDVINTQETKEGFLYFILNGNHSNLKEIKFEGGNFEESLLPQNWSQL